MPSGTNDEQPTLAGQLLADRYRLDAPIDARGTGEVWSARDTVLNRPVAVKLINQDQSQDEASASRFRAESRSAAALSHSGVAKVFDYGEHDSTVLPCQYLVMEHVSGRPLTELLAQADPLPADLVLDITAQAARALQAAHDIGITHGNVRPANLLVTDDGWVKLTDFGIGPAGPGPQAGTAAGADTWRVDAYLSPEQAEGHPSTPASDIYSLGVIAYESLTGRLPFSGHAAGRPPQAPAGGRAAGEPRPLPDQIPAGVRDLVMRMIASDPWLRPGTALAVAETATALREQLPADLLQPAAPPAPPSAGPQWPQAVDDEPDAATTTAPQPVVPANRAGAARHGRRRALAAVAVALGVTALCGAIAAMMSGGGRPPAPPSKQAGSPAPGVQGVVPAIGPTVRPSKSHLRKPPATASSTGRTAPPTRASATAPAPQHHPSSAPPTSSSPSPAPTHSSPSPSPTPTPTSPSAGASSGTGTATG